MSVYNHMMSKPHKVRGLESRMLFGKYKGATVQSVLTKDIGYMDWALSNTSLTLDPEAMAVYEGLSELGTNDDPGDELYWNGK